jgi:hypothetical protein
MTKLQRYAQRWAVIRRLSVFRPMALTDAIPQAATAVVGLRGGVVHIEHD